MPRAHTPREELCDPGAHVMFVIVRAYFKEKKISMFAMTTARIYSHTEAKRKSTQLAAKYTPAVHAQELFSFPLRH